MLVALCLTVSGRMAHANRSDAPYPAMAGRINIDWIRQRVAESEEVWTMTLFAASGGEVRERRIRVEGNRVACQRVGTVELERCRECLYLLRLQIAGTPPAGHVVCAASYLEEEFDFAW